MDKEKKTQITEVRNESGDIAAQSTEMKKNYREYYEVFYTNRLDT